MACDGLLGRDLGDIIKSTCQHRGIHVELAAIVNDSTAALLSEAYLNSSTRFGLILGTGVNIAVHLPVPTIGREKFGDRPASWFEKASHVIVNTELGMFGTGILPVTRWDVALNESHLRPNFQPLEHLVSGCYLGEVCRLVLVEAIDTTGLFGGVVPPSLLLPYSLDTETLSIIEAYVAFPSFFLSFFLSEIFRPLGATQLTEFLPQRYLQNIGIIHHTIQIPPSIPRRTNISRHHLHPNPCLLHLAPLQRHCSCVPVRPVGVQERSGDPTPQHPFNRRAEHGQPCGGL